MIKMENKLLAFEYFVYSIIRYYKENLNMSEDEALSNLDRLRTNKLLFFVSANSSSEKDLGILSIFNKFYAVPFGHTEYDVDDAIRYDKLLFYKIGLTTSIKNNTDFSELDTDIKDRIDSVIVSLLDPNNHLLTCRSFELVDLSHAWYSWKETYKMARSINRTSLPIGNKVIQKETKFYKLI